MAKIRFDNTEKEKEYDANRERNLPVAILWIDRHDSQCFKIKNGEERYSLKVFLSSDKKILWMEFRSTGLFPNFSCPVALDQDPSKFPGILQQEWKNINSRFEGLMNKVGANGII